MSDSYAPQTQPPTMIGRVLGNYLITEELSRGGMGTVYRAQHQIIGRAAAVKVLRPELTANSELVQRFFNEAKAATAIRHPGIIEVFDFGYDSDGHAYLVMEFLDGDTLGKRITDRGRISEREAAQITRGIASALTAAHKRGIVHRDLKPDNIFLVPDPDLPSGERPKVLDFGIAKLADPVPTSVSHTVTGALMGTPLYMAPEQARAAGEIDHRADLYSLGCILYELLVGEPPFLAEGAGEIIAMQLFGKPEPPSTRLETISPEMETIVMRLLEKQPADRYQTAAELSHALDNVVGSLRVRPSAPLTAASSRPQITLGSHSAVTLQASPQITQTPANRRNRLPLIAGCVTIAAISAIGSVMLLSPKDEPKPQAHALRPPPVPPVTPLVMQQVAPPAPVQVAPPAFGEVKPPPPPSPPPPLKQAVHEVDKPPVHIHRPSHGVVSSPHPIDAKDQKTHTDKGSPIEVNLDSKDR